MSATATVRAEMSRAEAVELWGQLKQALINLAKVFEEIVERRAWEPLGYRSFTEAWAAEMREFTLAKELRPHVVYQMFAEGTAPEDVADLVKGVGPRGAEDLARQRQNGVPADFAVVNEHLRRKPSAPDTVHVRVGHTLLAEYKRIATSLGLTVEEIAKEAIAERFSDLVSRKSRRKSA